MHTLGALLLPPHRAVASEQSCLISVSVGNGVAVGGGWEGWRLGGLQLWVVAVSCCALTHRVIVLHTLICLMYYCGDCASLLPLTHITLPDIQITSKSMSQIELVVI